MFIRNLRAWKEDKIDSREPCSTISKILFRITN
jgi:hypothetical protein